MEYSQGGPDRFLKLTGLLIGVLAIAAVLVLIWSSGNHGTHCSQDAAAFRDAWPLERPIVHGCIAASLGLAGVLLALSVRRRRLAGASDRRVGVVSAALAGLTVWCAAVILISPQGSWLDGSARVVFTAVPFAVLLGVGLLTLVVQYALFGPGLILLGVALTRDSRACGYRWMQATVVYTQLGCAAVALGSSMLLTGFCGFG